MASPKNNEALEAEQTKNTSKTESENPEVSEPAKPEIVETKVEEPKVEKPEPKTLAKTTKSAKGTLALVFSCLALVLGTGGMVLGWMGYEQARTPVTYLNNGADGNSANFVEGSIADVAAKVSKSVVSIITSTKTTSFFGQSYDSSAAGTGVIVTGDGYILTNKHVISGASKVTVVLHDGTTYEKVKVVATDSLNDIAFVKIDDVSGLEAATLGNSKTISVGQQVIAIGNALGQYQNTVTSGIISGLGRSVTASDGTGYNTETLSDMIQTDAAINSGNSGGPLVNAAGEVIGINTATSTTAENMGFAIPISAAKGMLAQLVETGKATRAYLGVYSIEITPDVAKNYNLPVTHGAYIYSPSSYSAVIKNTPAAKAGVKDKDIITKINGVEVGAAGSVSTLISEYKPGDVVDLTIIREGKEISIKVTLEGYDN